MSVEVVLVHLVLVPELKPRRKRCALLKLNGGKVRLKDRDVQILHPERFNVVPAHFDVGNCEMSEQHRVG
jgi:hypothetical protein